MTTTTMTTGTAPIINRYRKTKAGEWVILGGADEITAAARLSIPVLVSKANGQVEQVDIARAGREFVVDGRRMAYGYIAPKATAPRQTRSTHRTCITGGNCSSFGSGQSCGAGDCDGY